MSDTIAIMCPACGVRMTVPRSGGGRPAARTRCLRCKEVFTVGDGVRTATGAHPAPQLPGAPPPVQVPPPVQAPPPVRAPPRASTTVPVEGHADADLQEWREHWEVDRPDFDEAAFTTRELEDVARQGPLLAGDRVRKVGDDDWVEAGSLEKLQKYFLVRQKKVQQKLAQIARKHKHKCSYHPRDRADYVCVMCANTFCYECPILEDGKQLCPECRYELAPLK